MKAKRLISFVLAAAFMLSAAATPVFAAAALPQQTAAVEQENGIVSIRIKATGDLVYGSDYKLEVQTTPADTQYIGVVVGVGGEANGYVTLMLSDKIRTLLKMIPLPRVMSKTPDQVEEFNVYNYLKQLIDGNDVGVLLRVADEVVSVMDVLHFYVPTIDQVSNGLRLALNLIRKYLPEGAFSRIYLDEQPVDSGNYVAGALALESSDMNTAGFALFRIKPKRDGVRMYWAQQAEQAMTAEELEAFNEAAVLEVDGQVVPTDKIRYTYKKQGWFTESTGELPTKPGTYTQTAEIGGNYNCSKISRNIIVKKCCNKNKAPHLLGAGPCCILRKNGSHAEPEAPAAAAAVAQQVQQDHAPAPLHQAAGACVGGLGGAVGLAGVLHPAQVHLVFGVIGVQLHGAAGILQRINAVAQTLIGKGGKIIPPCIASGHAVQHPAGLRVAAIDHKVAGGLHFRAVGAGVAGALLAVALLLPAEAEPEAEGVEAVKTIKAAKTAVTVLVALLLIALLAVALLVAAVGIAALRAGLAFGDGVISRLHLFEVLFGGGVVGVQVRVPALAFGAVCFFDLVIACAARNAQHLIGISHGYTSSRLISCSRHCGITFIVYRIAVQKSSKTAQMPRLRASFAVLQLYLSHTPEYRMLRSRSASSTQGRRSKLWAHCASSSSKISFISSS